MLWLSVENHEKLLSQSRQTAGILVALYFPLIRDALSERALRLFASVLQADRRLQFGKHYFPQNALRVHAKLFSRGWCQMFILVTMPG